MTSLHLRIFPFEGLLLLYKLVLGDDNVKVDNLITLKDVALGRLIMHLHWY